MEKKLLLQIVISIITKQIIKLQNRNKQAYFLETEKVFKKIENCINKKEFLSCIDRATLLVKEGDKKPIIINITDGDLELKISFIFFNA